jgi:hypothetical protein
MKNSLGPELSDLLTEIFLNFKNEFWKIKIMKIGYHLIKNQEVKFSASKISSNPAIVCFKRR